MPVTEPLSDAFGYGLAADRPAAGIPGRVYYSTDTEALERDNGTTWDALAVGGGGADLTVQEVDGSPTYTGITDIVVPNNSLSIAGTVATLRDVPQAFIGASVYASTTQNVLTGAQDVVAFDQTIFDSDLLFDNANNRFVIPAGLGGKFRVGAAVNGDSGASANVQTALTIRKNGTAVRGGQSQMPHTASFGAQFQDSVTLDLVPGDTVDVTYYNGTSGTRVLGHASVGSSQSYFEIVKLDSGSAGQGVGCKAYHNTTQVSPSVFALNSEEFDTDNFHDLVTNNSRMTIPAGLSGKYLLVGNIYDSSAGSGDLWFLKNSATAVRGTYSAGSGELGTQSVAIADLLAGEWVEMTTSIAGTYGHASDPKIQVSFSIMRLDSSKGGSVPPAVSAAALTRAYTVFR